MEISDPDETVAFDAIPEVILTAQMCGPLPPSQPLQYRDRKLAFGIRKIRNETRKCKSADMLGAIPVSYTHLTLPTRMPV